MKKEKNNHRWRVLSVGVAANASFSCVFLGIPATALVIRTTYEINNSHLGIAFGLLGLGISISEIPWGLLTDKWGDRRVLLLGLLLTSLALTSMAVLTSAFQHVLNSYLIFSIGLLVVGVLGGSVNGSSGRAVMSWFSDNERGLAMSIRQIAIPLGGGVGAVLLPYIALKWGMNVVFFMLAAVCGLVALSAAAWIYEPKLSFKTSHQAREITKNSPLKRIDIWCLVAGMGTLCIPQFSIMTFGAIFLHDFARAGQKIISLILLVIQLSAIALRILGGYTTDKKKNRRQYLRTCCAVSAFIFLILSMVTSKHIFQSMTFSSSVMISIIFVIAGAIVMAWQGVAYAELATMAGTQFAGTALGMANTFMYAAFFIVPITIPILLISSFGWLSVWIGVSICCCFTYFLFPAPYEQATTIIKTASP